MQTLLFPSRQKQTICKLIHWGIGQESSIFDAVNKKCPYEKAFYHVCLGAGDGRAGTRQSDTEPRLRQAGGSATFGTKTGGTEGYRHGGPHQCEQQFFVVHTDGHLFESRRQEVCLARRTAHQHVRTGQAGLREGRDRSIPQQQGRYGLCIPYSKGRAVYRREEIRKYQRGRLVGVVV